MFLSLLATNIVVTLVHLGFLDQMCVSKSQLKTDFWKTNIKSYKVETHTGDCRTGYSAPRGV